MNTLLWVDDEIELLKPYIIFLENKGYHVVTASNGQDAIDMCQNQEIDLILLDENMPGLSGLETLSQIKELNSMIPVVMVTMSEEEVKKTYAHFRWRIFYSSFIAYVVFHLCRKNIAVALPAMGADLHLSNTELGTKPDKL